MKRIFLILTIILISMVGCSMGSEQDEIGDVHANSRVDVNDEEADDANHQEADINNLEEKEIKVAKIYETIYTLDEILSLTFRGVTSQEKLDVLLEELDAHQIKTTFFVSNEDLKDYQKEIEHINC